VKLFPELTTVAASPPTLAICAAGGLDGSALTVAVSASTDDLIALVSLGKSLLAESTTFVASVSIVVTWVFRPLMLPLVARPGSALAEDSRLLRSEQYAGLLLPPHPAATTRATAATSAIATRVRERRPPVRDLFRLMLLEDWGTGTVVMEVDAGVPYRIVLDSGSYAEDYGWDDEDDDDGDSDDDRDGGGGGLAAGLTIGAAGALTAAAIAKRRKRGSPTRLDDQPAA
jgi:hypothetical protein